MTWGEASRSQLDNAVRSGHLVRLFPRTYVDKALMSRLSPLGLHDLRCRAALRYAAGAVLSHRTALAVWQLRHPQGQELIHVTVSDTVRLRCTTGIVVHHRQRPMRTVKRAGLVVTGVAEAIVDSWPSLAAEDRIGVVLEALTVPLVTINELADGLNGSPRLADKAELRRLVDLFAAGCHSPLEVWGALGVFTGPVLGKLERQVRVRIGGRTYIMDLFARREKVNFELDGAAFHGGRLQRERDLERDAAFAARGIVVVRFSYDRLMSDPGGVRQQAIAILNSRRP